MRKVYCVIILFMAVIHSDGQPAVWNNITKINIANVKKEHPRVMVSDFEPIKKDLAINPIRQEWLKELKIDKNPDAMALVYALTGDKSYADKAFASAMKYDMKKATQGGPHVYGRYIAYMGTTYDWIYGYMSMSQKKELLDRIKFTLQFYLNEEKDKGCWHNMNHCMHGGVIIAAVAIANEEPELAEKVINEAVNYLNMTWYKPDGITPEGPHYMAWSSLVMISGLATLDAAFGNGFGLSDEKGLVGYGEFRLHGDAPRGGMAVKFGDCYANQSVYTPGQLFWLANKHNRRDFFQFAIDTDPFVADVGNYHGKLHAMLWYDPSKFKTDSTIYNTIPLQKSFESGQLVVMRSGWRNRNALFAGIKGTDDYHQNNTFHRHTNTGTFFLQALGEEWAMDLGQESYLVKDYDSIPRKYYKLRAEGHNCNIINPALGVDNLGWDKCPIVSQGASLHEAFAVVDMSPDYQGIAKSAKRGLKMFDQRRKVLIQDEITSLDGKPMDSYWFMQTEAGIEIAPDGKSALLYRGGERMMVYMACAPTDARFTIMGAEPLVYTPIPPSKEGWNFGVKKLTIHTTTETDLKLAVVFVPVRHGEKAVAAPISYQPLDSWKVSSSKVALLSSISIGDRELTNFDIRNFTYDDYPKNAEIPIVSAQTTDINAKISIVQPKQIPGKAEITISSEGCSSSTYFIYFYGKPVRIVADAAKEYSSWDESFANHHVEAPKIVAGNFAEYDLGESTTVGAATIGFVNQTIPYNFEIQVSDNQKNWKSVYSGTTQVMNGLKVAMPQLFNFPTFKARYIRICNREKSENFIIDVLKFHMDSETAKEYINHAFREIFSNVKINQQDISLKIGNKLKLGIEGFSNYNKAVNLTEAKINFQSENPELADISSTGEISANKEGVTYIRIIIQKDDVVLHKKIMVKIIGKTT